MLAALESDSGLSGVTVCSRLSFSLPLLSCTFLFSRLQFLRPEASPSSAERVLGGHVVPLRSAPEVEPKGRVFALGWVLVPGPV